MFKTSLAAAFVALLCSTPVLAEPILIKFSHVVAEDTPKGKGALLFKQLVDERLAGKVKVEVYPNSSLFGDADELQALRDNKVQLLAPSLSKFEQYTTQLQVFDLPFLFDDLEAVKRFQKREKSRELLRSMAGHNIYGLAYWNNGMKQLSATRALHTPADAAGLTFRIQPSAILEQQFARVGASSLRLPFAETQAALQAGRVQGAENPWSNIVSQQLGALQPYVTETEHGVLSYMLVSSSSFWISIPYQVRVQLEAIIDEVTMAVNLEAEALNARDRQRLVAAGNQVVSLNSEQRAAWRAAMQPLWQEYEGKIGSDVLRAAQTVNRR
ncbi:DctP family TRAP transporter solute-binding subunit [Pseudomonas sp. MDMC216]|nr:MULTISPECIES: DctP family TRAP transporter solute-binding subunit [unclassified Pseudomonas]MBA4681898.1 DctP family TRAP transporter solute-binding subunit [Pseudomonas sp.]MDI5995139.1 DctP family TRAP transporter solute-binding subunit [Pseudomonas sp. MDMC216]MDI6008256.1 DctP family TRAP transporter solute-binding subunit [Pseudomonas sp. MDMC17]RAR38765.1 C4-dicarboxylate ABC transporter [Pseudomonas sp. MDMC224]